MADTEDGPEDYSKTPIDQLWAEWKVKFEKTYASKKQEEYRFKLFKKTVDFIQAHNSKYLSGKSSHYCGLNQFADLKPSEVCCGGRRRCGRKSTKTIKAAPRNSTKAKKAASLNSTKTKNAAPRNSAKKQQRKLRHAIQRKQRKLRHENLLNNNCDKL